MRTGIGRNKTGDVSISRLRERVSREPGNAALQRKLGRALRAAGDDAGAVAAEMAAIHASTCDPELLGAATALHAGDLADAEFRLRARLSIQPLDVAAIRMMAELAGRLGRLHDAETLLKRALELAPGFTAARANLATVLYRQARYGEASALIEDVLAAEPDHVGNRNLQAATLGRIGDYDEALTIYAELLAIVPGHAKLWMSYGHMLKTVGRQEEAIAAYRHALEIEPSLGEVWWSLANLKTVAFGTADIATMQAALEGEPTEEDALHLHFALGKARSDIGDTDPAFRHYEAGNALRRAELGYDPAVTTLLVDRTIAALTPEYLALHQGSGDATRGPIFIVGLPRSGSTLLEQILASHSEVEGTMELPDIPAIAMREAKREGAERNDWPSIVPRLSPDRFAELGAEYLERTRIQRKTDRPLFIDKLPNNWAYAGFIHLVLPNAKIVDARRHPLDCGFSNFRQHFAKGQAFSYGLDHIGRYYADYVRAMDHYDAVLPGRIIRVVHEDLLDDPEVEVRRLLAALELPFEDACLAFHRNTRAVRTASSEQVRRPINRDGVGAWQPYSQWLGQLRNALGDLPTTYARRSRV